MNQEEFIPEVDQGTKLDSICDIRQYLPSDHTPTTAEPPAIDSQSPSNTGCDPSLPFRPVTRPPMALLMVMDDGTRTGEMIRLRNAIFRIGREAGDLIHDTPFSVKTAPAEHDSK